MKWCPAPNCEHAVECIKDLGPNEPLDVTCKCGSTFCFACKEEAHRPVCSCSSVLLLSKSRACRSYPQPGACSLTCGLLSAFIWMSAAPAASHARRPASLPVHSQSDVMLPLLCLSVDSAGICAPKALLLSVQLSAQQACRQTGTGACRGALMQQTAKKSRLDRPARACALPAAFTGGHCFSSCAQAHAFDAAPQSCRH